MSYKPNCSICPRLVFSQSITFSENTLIVNLPAGSYNNNEKYCIVLTQQIPQTATIGSPVVFTIGTGDVQYPLTDRCCRQVTVCGIRTRTRYSVCVSTNATGGIFKMIGNPCCAPNNQLTSINGTAPAVTASAASLAVSPAVASEPVVASVSSKGGKA